MNDAQAVWIGGHLDADYNGEYLRQQGKINGRPWFRNGSKCSLFWYEAHGHGGACGWNLSDRSPVFRSDGTPEDRWLGGYLHAHEDLSGERKCSLQARVAAELGMTGKTIYVKVRKLTRAADVRALSEAKDKFYKDLQACHNWSTQYEWRQLDDDFTALLEVVAEWGPRLKAVCTGSIWNAPEYSLETELTPLQICNRLRQINNLRRQFNKTVKAISDEIDVERVEYCLDGDDDIMRGEPLYIDSVGGERAYPDGTCEAYAQSSWNYPPEVAELASLLSSISSKSSSTVRIRH